MKFVKIPGKDFEMSVYQCTQVEWQKVMGNNPSYFKGNKNPVEQVSWNDVQEFLSKVNSKKGKYTYRLPTEEEWEYACRAGSTTDFCFGNDEKELEDYAWFYTNSGNKVHSVGLKKPNKFGLYDMHGNVWEWCQDLWFKDSSYRVLRGGSWYGDPLFLRSAQRSNGDAGLRYFYIGFRLVRTSLLPSNALTLPSAHMKQRMWRAYRAKARRDFLALWKEMKMDRFSKKL
jgi:formylglycine-generating enzyme required for sulfatase activity